MHTLKNTLLFSFFFIWTSNIIWSQVAINLPHDGQRKLINFESEVYPAYDFDLTAKEVLSKIENEELQPISEKVNPSFDNAIHWVKCRIENNEAQEIEITLEIDKPRTDQSDLYEIKQDTIVHWAVSGDRLGHFNKRTHQNRRVIMNAVLAPNSSHDYLISVDQVGAPANFPIYLWRANDFAEDDITINFAQGGYFGIIIFLALIFFSIGIWTKNKLFVAYAAYISITGLFLFNDLGFAYQYLFPGASIFTNYSRTLIALLVMVALRKFLIEYFDLEKVLHKWVKRFYLGSVIAPFVVLIAWISYRSYFNNHTFIILNIVYLCATIYIAITVGSILYLIKTQTRNALSFLFAFSGLAIGYLVYVAIEYGYMEEQNLLMSPLQLGSLFEVIALTMLIINRIKEMSDRQSDLMTKVANSQKSLALSIVNTQEAERTNIAREIHDAIGGNLAVIKQKAEKSNPESVPYIENTLNHVRQLSHSLYTPIFNSNDLQIRLTALANEVQMR